MKNVKTVDLKMILSGLARTVIHMEQKFSADLEMNGCTYKAEFHSLPDKDIMCVFIVGRSLFLTSAELKISLGIVEVNKILSDIQQVVAIEIE